MPLSRSHVGRLHRLRTCHSSRLQPTGTLALGVIFIGILAAITVLAQPSPPAQGIHLSNFSRFPGWDIRFPLTVTQCEPVFIYYNNTYSDTAGLVGLRNLNLESILVLLGPFPLGVGYFEWICNIPANFGFWVSSPLFYDVVVQPGSISSCLHPITTTYQYVTYDMTFFAAYTANLPTMTTAIVAQYELAT